MTGIGCHLSFVVRRSGLRNRKASSLLHPCADERRETKDGARWKLDVRGSRDCRYPLRSCVRLYVIPAKAGIQFWNTSVFDFHPTLDPGFRRGDGNPFEFVRSLGPEILP